MNIETATELTADIGFGRTIHITTIDAHYALAIVGPLPMSGAVTGMRRTGLGDQRQDGQYERGSYTKNAGGYGNLD